MKVAFVTQGATVPASRFRVAQIVPALAATGEVTCTVLPCSPSVYGDVASGKLHGPWRRLAQPLSIVSRVRQLSAIDGHDVAWLQRPLVQFPFASFERRIAAKTATVFDFDDAIFLGGMDRRKVTAILGMVDRVVAGNRYLADFAAEAGAGGKTQIIPTVVDDERYTVRDDPGDAPFTIVWTGLSSNLKELAPYADAYRRVLAETGGRMVIVSDRFDAPFLEGARVEFVKWSPDVEVSALGAGHAGIMPIVDTPYNRGKCGFKLIQYMARAIPVVASPVGANADIVRAGVDGYHARTSDEWAEALLALARDREARVRMGAAARARVEATYSVRAVVPQYLAAMRAAIAR